MTAIAPPPAATTSEPEPKTYASIATGARRPVPSMLQMSEVECGAVSLGMILARHGRWVPVQELRIACGISRDGATALDLVNAAKQYGLEGKGHLGPGIEKLDGLAMPAIIWLRKSHFAVLEGAKHGKYYINDPGSGRYRFDADEFAANYSDAALTFELTDAFKTGGHKFRVVGALAQRLRNSRIGVTYAFVAGLLAMLLGLATAPISKVFVNNVMTSDQSRGVGVIVGALLAIGLFRGALTLLEYATLTRLQTKFSLVGSASFVDHLLRLPVAFYLQRTAGDLSQRVSYNTQIAQLLAAQFAAAAIALIGVIGYAALLVYYQWLIGLIVVALALLNVVILQVVIERRRTAQSRIVHEQNNLRGTTVSAIKSIETLKATGMADQVFASLTGQQARYISAQSAMVTSTAVLGAAPTVLLALMSATVLVIGSLLVVDGSFSFGALLAMQTLAAGLYSPIQTLMGTGSQIQVIAANVQALDDVLVNPEDDVYTRTPEAIASETFDGSISVHNVTFGYSRTHKPVLIDFSLDLPAGARVALVGVSGAGKTTIGNMAAGLVEPWGGEVRFSGRPITDFPRRSLAGALAKVDQSIVLFEGTVSQNVALWDTTISTDDVVAALRDAQLLDEILARPDGIDAYVAEDGRNFSGGQCQRMEIARALATNPRALILDEATSALDATTEKKVDDALRARGVTCLIIAHRLSTIRDADEIVVLGRGGSVMERGTHDELMAAQGEYFRLVDGAGRVAMSVRDAINLAPGTDPVEVRDGTADVFYVDEHGLIVPVASVAAGAVVLAASDHAQLRVVPRIDAVIESTPSAADDVAGVQAFVDALVDRIGPDLSAPLEQCAAADVPGVLAELLPRYVEQQKAQHSRAAAAGIQADIDRLSLAYRRAEQDIKHPGAALGRTSRDPLVAVVGLIGDAQGFSAREPAANSVTNDVRADARLAGIAHASGVRYRPVRLAGDWRKSAAVPYLGFVGGREGEMTPVALIPHGTRYRMHFADGHSVPLSDDQHERLQVWAFEFYTPLPRDRAVTPRDVARLAMRGTRRDWWVIVAMAAAVVGLGLLTPILTQVLLNDFVPHGDKSMIMQAGLALVVAAFVIGAFSMVQYFAMSRVAQRATARVQPALWDRVLSMPTSFFRNFSSGDLSVRVMAADALQQLVNVQVVGAVLAALFSMVNLVLMFHYNVMLGVAGLVVLVVTLAVMGWALLAMQGLYTQSIDAQLVGTSWVVQLLTGIGKVRLANAEVRMQSTYLDLVRRQVVALSRMTSVIGRAQAWVVFATSGATALFFALIGVQWGSNGTMVTSSTFVAFNTAFVAAFGAIAGVTASLVTLASAAPIFKLLEPIMEGLPEAASHKADPGPLRGDLEFRNVTFRYGTDSPVVLDRMNFKIEAGQMVAIVGASGSGKSTMIRQMLGFEEPTDGQVLLDGRNLCDLDLDLVRAQMGVVIQDGKITRTSILKNILGGAGNDERLAWEAAAKAALADDIRAMPMKMQTVVDPQLLSGGQAQRIMLARALVRRPNVVVLDEATSALDNLAQASVTEALTQLGATRIVVAHRLSTIRLADRILVVANGRVIEDGGYDTLMAKPEGAFRALAQRQLA